MSLLELLREELGITSVKDGCAPEGSCGACTVLVNGKAVVSCAQKAEHAAGRDVVTQEGLSSEEREQWADGFIVSGASQCGFCSPGILMKAEGLLAKTPSPTRDQISKALAGNLCRCTGYIKIVDAVELVAKARAGEPMPEVDMSGRIGSRTARYEGRELALGDKPYINDLTAPRMLHGAIRFSDHPRARVLGIATERASAHPGVVRVLLAPDVPGRRVQGAITKDWPQLVAEGETTRYVGDALAVVIAESRHAAREAAELVDVEYEVLEPVIDPFAALEPGAPRLHEAGNLLSTSIVKRGDVEEALEGSAHVLTETFRTQFIEHAFLEPESALA
ncbi:MAG: 2Fe-2S iron-sulfur cluster-binding protein, partial [Actinomycetota bacterium]